VITPWPPFLCNRFSPPAAIEGNQASCYLLFVAPIAKRMVQGARYAD
jgi:hypothetical protein